jgi:hypothetical protein
LTRPGNWLNDSNQWKYKDGNAKRVYAWSHLDGNKEVRTRFVAVLEIPPVKSAETAVRMQIVNDFKKGK